MLDGIGKKRKKIQPVTFEELKQASDTIRPKRNIDEFKKQKISRIHASYIANKKRPHIKKAKLQKRWKIRIAIFSAVILILAAAGFAISQTKVFKLFRLLNCLSNQTILVGFQNSAELRPTGGFWGSFALWQIKKNPLQSTLLFETNPYKKDNPLLAQMTSELPKPMKETYTNRPQSFVNANWPIDFPESAKTIEWYFGQGWGKNVQGVVAVSSLAMIDLLKLTGSIQSADKTEISSDNFTEIMSKKIDTEYWYYPENIEKNEPKTIISEIAPEIILKAKNLPKKILYQFLLDQMRQGRILAYFNNPNQQKIARELGIDGKASSYKVDYLSINNANLNGGKSSLNVYQNISYKVYKNNGKNIGQVELKRNHLDKKWPDILNRNYTRVFVPLGSRLISIRLQNEDLTKNVEINDENGKTNFGFWFSVSPGEEKTAQIIYELPFKIGQISEYELILQKQPGTNPDQFSANIFDKNLYRGVVNDHLNTLKFY